MVKSVLFVCNMNSVRSPIAAALMRDLVGEGAKVDSAGVDEGWLDPFAAAVMAEVGISLDNHAPKVMRADAEDQPDLVVALTEHAKNAAMDIFPEDKIEFWEVENPSETRGGRDEVMAAYRKTRDALRELIGGRFPELCQKS